MIEYLTRRVSELENKMIESCNQPVTSEKYDTAIAQLQRKISNIETNLKEVKAMSYATTLINKPPPALPGASLPQTSTPIKGKPTTSTENSSKRKPKPRPPFHPDRCLVITGLSLEQFKSLNQDTIRIEINKQFGPTMIDFINAYKPQSENPKYMLQLSDPKPNTIDDMIQSWNQNSLGGSTLRRTIKPPEHVGMAKGVPLFIDDITLAEDVKNSYPTASVYRLKSKEGNRLRTVKVTFSTKEDLDHALLSGLLLSSQSTLVRVETPYNVSKIITHDA